MDISVVVPLYNEEESLPELYAWIERVMDAHHFTYEVIFVNDGSTDHSWQVIEELSRKSKEVKGIKFRRNYGKSPALFCGFEKAEGDVVITMDADLQDSPDEIPELYRMITEEGYDLVSGWKQKRYDPLSKTIPTKLFNATARAVSGIHNLHDFNCGLKAYRKDVVKISKSMAKCTDTSPTWPRMPVSTASGRKWYIIRHVNMENQIRTEPLCQRLPGFTFLVVPFHFRSKAHAHFRLFGFHHVYVGIHCCHRSRSKQTV